MKFLLPVFAAGAVAASLGTPTLQKKQQAIVEAALAAISSATVDLDTAILAVNGPEDAPGVLTASDNLANTLRTQTANVAASDNLSEDEAFPLLVPVNALADTVNKTIDDLIGKRTIIVDNCFGQITLTTLQTQRSLAATFADTTISKVPQIFQGVATDATAPILASLDQGIAAYADQATPPAQCTGTTTTTTTSTSSSTSTSTSSVSTTTSSTSAITSTSSTSIYGTTTVTTTKTPSETYYPPTYGTTTKTTKAPWQSYYPPTYQPSDSYYPPYTKTSKTSKSYPVWQTTSKQTYVPPYPSTYAPQPPPSSTYAPQPPPSSSTYAPQPPPSSSYVPQPPPTSYVPQPPPTSYAPQPPPTSYAQQPPPSPTTYYTPPTTTTPPVVGTYTGAAAPKATNGMAAVAVAVIAGVAMM